MNASKKILFAAGVFGVAGLHYVVTFLWAFNLGMKGGPWLPFTILAFPFSFAIASGSLSLPAMQIIQFGLSLCWGLAVCGIAYAIARLISHR